MVAFVDRDFFEVGCVGQELVGDRDGEVIAQAILRMGVDFPIAKVAFFERVRGLLQDEAIAEFLS
jgi:hypothetical protein